MPTLECEVCGRKFRVFPSRIKQAERKGSRVRFCSMKCRTIAYTGEGNPMYGKKHRRESVEKMIRNPNRPKFKCGKGNPNYKRFPESLLTKEKERILRRLFFQYVSYERIAQKLGTSKNTIYKWVKGLGLKRDYRTIRAIRKQLIREVGKCERCGYNRVKDILLLHHKDGNRRNNMRENLIIICPTCHEEIHYIEGTGRYNRSEENQT